MSALPRLAARLAVAALAAGLLGPGSARAAGPAKLLEDFTIALPPGGKTTVRLLVPPVPDEVAERTNPVASGFAVGPGGAVWLLLEPGVLVHATRGLRLRPAVAVADLAVLDGGGLLVATQDAVGFLVPEPPAPGAGEAAPGRVAFQPIADLPVQEAHLASGEGGALYLHGPAREGGGQAVYLLAPEPVGAGPAVLRTFRRVFSTTERIAAVAGDGRTTYVATGKLVVKVSGGSRKPEAVLLAREPLTGLALSRGLLFYATPTGAGVVAPGGAVELVRAPGLALRASGDALYLLVRRTLAVVAVEGLEPLRAAGLTARKAP